MSNFVGTWLDDFMPAELKTCIWSPSRFRDNSCFFETGKKFIE